LCMRIPNGCNFLLL